MKTEDKIKCVLNSIPKEELSNYLIYTCGYLENCDGGIIDDIINKYKFRCMYSDMIIKNKEESLHKNMCLIYFINDKIKQYDLPLNEIKEEL